MRIAVDFDDTLVDTVSEVLKALNKRQFGGIKDWELTDIKTWEMSSIVGFSPDIIMEEFSHVDYEIARPIHRSFSTLREIANNHDVQIVTSNPRLSVIEDFLELCGLGDLEVVSVKDKWKYIAENSFSVFVDDKPTDLDLVSSTSMTYVIRFLRPWNEEIFHWGTRTNQYTAANWGDVLGIILVLDAEMNRQREYLNIGEAPGEPYVNDILGEEFVAGDPSFRPSDVIKPHTGQLAEAQDVIVNSQGAKQSDIKAAFHLIPAKAITDVAQVLEYGAKKYGAENWRGLSEKEILNHVIAHLFAYLDTGETEDLSHATTRALMALEIHLGGGTNADNST